MAAVAAALTLAAGEMMLLMLLLQLRIGRFCHICRQCRPTGGFALGGSSLRLSKERALKRTRKAKYAAKAAAAANAASQMLLLLQLRIGVFVTFTAIGDC